MSCQLLKKIAIAIIVMAVLFPLAAATSISSDKTGIVFAVIDGSSFQLSSGETIKLAAIDTPSSGQAGFSESKNYLITLILGKTVILDNSAPTITDQQGRLLCVVYLDYNLTYYENVNMAMIQNGYAAPSSPNNSGFDTTAWTWFVSKETPTTTPSATIGPQTTETPTPTPFSQSSPSISPSIPELSSNITFLIMGIITLLFTSQIVQKKKKLREF